MTIPLLQLRPSIHDPKADIVLHLAAGLLTPGKIPELPSFVARLARPHFTPA